MRHASALLISTILAVCVSAPTVAQSDAPVGATIHNLRGDVRILSPGATTWHPARLGERIPPGGRLRTSAGAEALLRLSAGNDLLIRGGSEVLIHDITTRPGRGEAEVFRLEMPHGRMRAALRGLRPGSRVDLLTPVATVGVRGTVFTAEVFRRRAGAREIVDADFACAEGSINLSGGVLPRPVTVRAGYGMSLTDRNGRMRESPRPEPTGGGDSSDGNQSDAGARILIDVFRTMPTGGGRRGGSQDGGEGHHHPEGGQ